MWESASGRVMVYFDGGLLGVAFAISTGASLRNDGVLYIGQGYAKQETLVFEIIF